jgi:peptide/nickel transport system permease protein
VLKVVVHRLAGLLPILLVVVLVVFLLSQLMPGDQATIIAGDLATPEEIDALRVRLGLDRPMIEQFGSYVNGLLHGDMGTSVRSSQPVSKLVMNAIPPTVSLALVAMIVGVAIGFSGGIIASLRRGKPIDRLISVAAAVALSVPTFVFGLLFVVFFAINRRWFPATGYQPLSEGFGGWLKPLVLPGVALSLNLAAEVARQVRGALVETLEQDFIRTSRANGLSWAAVVLKHGMRNAAVPVVTVIGLQTGGLLSGTVVVEGVFAVPGVGSLAYGAALGRDITLIQGVTLVSALVVLVVNLIVDVSCAYLNPRLRS